MITNLRMELFEALADTEADTGAPQQAADKAAEAWQLAADKADPACRMTDEGML